MRENHLGDLFISHVVLEEFFDEFFADLLIVHMSEEFTKARGFFFLWSHDGYRRKGEKEKGGKVKMWKSRKVLLLFMFLIFYVCTLEDSWT